MKALLGRKRDGSVLPNSLMGLCNPYNPDANAKCPHNMLSYTFTQTRFG